MTDKFARHSGLVNAMSRIAGVDLGRRVVEGTLVPTDLTGVVATCACCENVAACESFLCAGDGAEAAAEPAAGGGVPDYCLNRPLFSILKPG